jgi:hypothetical protein
VPSFETLVFTREFLEDFIAGTFTASERRRLLRLLSFSTPTSSIHRREFISSSAT